MSGTAANDIRALLGDSIQRVEQVVSSTRERVQGLISSGAEKVQSGTALAERCKTTLDKIAGAVNQVDERVQEIAVASGEQNRGVSEISKAIGELDTATQQNSTAVQEVASASAQLANQASSLATLVGDLYSLVRGKGTSGSVSTSVQTADSGTKSLARLSRKFRQKNNVTNEENGAGRNQKAA
jgi:methyl-accepting chemotaxis protein